MINPENSEQLLHWIEKSHEAYYRLIAVTRFTDPVNQATTSLRQEYSQIIRNNSEADPESPENLKERLRRSGEALLRLEAAEEIARTITGAVFLAQYAAFEKLHKHLLQLCGKDRRDLASQSIEQLEKLTKSIAPPALFTKHESRFQKLKLLRNIRNFFVHELGEPLLNESDAQAKDLMDLKKAADCFSIRLEEEPNMFTRPHTTLRLIPEASFLSESLEIQKLTLNLVIFSFASELEVAPGFIRRSYLVMRYYSKLGEPILWRGGAT